jgi:hypothetical protein
VELQGTRAQAGVYVHGITEVLDQNGWSDRIRVAVKGFFVLTKPGSNRPSVRAHEDLRYQAARAARGLEKLRALAASIAPSGRMPADPVAAVLAAPTRYQEACIRFCDRAPGCYKRALDAGDPAALGDDVVRLLGTISLTRVCELLDGAKPTTHAERELIKLAAAGGKR